jgi:hypothetical protein
MDCCAAYLRDDAIVGLVQQIRVERAAAERQA